MNMKRLVFILAVSLFCGTLFAQSNTKSYASLREDVAVPTEEVTAENDDDKVYTAVEQPAEFPGGMRALMTWLSNNIKYPVAAFQNGISGRVTVRFVINKNGEVEDATILKGVNEDLDNEALRVVRQLPRWIPGKNEGKNVNTYFSLPVTFRIPESEPTNYSSSPVE